MALSVAPLDVARYPAGRHRTDYGYPVATVRPAGCRRGAQPARLDGMTLPHSITHDKAPLTVRRVAASALAALGAASAIPIPLAQLDFAGLINVFNIDSGDSQRALLVIVGVGGVLTSAVLALALAGSFLAASGAPAARPVLIAAALAGLVTATPFWIPAAVLIGAAALLLGQPQNDKLDHGRRAAMRRPGIQTCTLREGES
jgi:hypothetical protein